MKNKSTLLKGMLTAMKDSGAELVKTDETHLYFHVKINSSIDNQSSLQIAKEAFDKLFGMGLKIKRIK